jgi:hydrogenase maturation protein HypF
VDRSDPRRIIRAAPFADGIETRSAASGAGRASVAIVEPPETAGRQAIARLRLEVRGAVQGVGFRPFVYRLARRLGLRGMVLNSPAGVTIEIEGDDDRLEEFAGRLRSDAPPAASIGALETARLSPAGYTDFTIRPSEEGPGKSATILPDRAICDACRFEIADPDDRRFGYPFTNCIDCGPRYTIVSDIPYDRPHTTMTRFRMCADCRREYDDPDDRRFHAQPNACPRCGPRLSLADARGAVLPGDPLAGAAHLIRSGGILALKGIGGFQLLADAGQPAAVRRLRALKHRESKPFAVMFPALEAVRAHCLLGAAEETLLTGAAAPIVLLRAIGGTGLAPEVSNTSPWVGAMLPTSPLHDLLLTALRRPVVATSGNRSDEPIAHDNAGARARLEGVADGFLWHDRPIARPCDDSVARVMDGSPVVLRRARGYAPLPIELSRLLPRVLAVGSHMKNAPAIAFGRQVILAQHIGDLDAQESREALARAVDDLMRLYAFRPEMVACDLHPDYASTRFAEALGLPVMRVQHHQAHAAACAAENGLTGPYLGVAWDGTGYGTDGTIWGGEFLAWDGGAFHRVARLRPFPLPGGESAVRDGRRVAFGLLSQLPALAARATLGLDERTRFLLGALMARRVNTPMTSSAGRLFDAVAAIAGVAATSAYEGEAAMRLEAALRDEPGRPAYPLPLLDGGHPMDLDWRPLVAAALHDATAGVPPSAISLRFHNALAAAIVSVARHAGLRDVVLSGGVFQNGALVERARARLLDAGFHPFIHHRVPPNDGGLALGQAVLAAARR